MVFVPSSNIGRLGRAAVKRSIMMSAPSSAVSGRYGEAPRRCAPGGRWRGSVPEELAELLEDFIADALAMVGIDVPHVVDIDEQNRDFSGLRVFQFALEALDEVAAL